MKRIDCLTAVSNYETNLERARWTSKGGANPDLFAVNRLRKDIFRPAIANKFTFTENSKFFAMGSCFAREVEHALSSLGINALSLVKPGDPINFRKGGYTNRYNTHSMLNEIKFAFGKASYNPRSIVAVDSEKTKFLDLHSHSAGGFVSFDECLSRREFLKKYFSRLANTDVFVVTLGLVEAWFDHETNEYINVSPASGDLFKLYKDRFELRVMSHAESLENLEELYDILKAHATVNLKIIVTTSPVPLLATFSGQDVVLANTYSKSTLRSCAENWCWSHPDEIEYFPSYEMAINSNPDLVWEEDRIHVRPVFVRQIMKTFLSNYIGGWKHLSVVTPEESQQISAAIADGMVLRGSHKEGLAQIEQAFDSNDQNVAYLATICRAEYEMKHYDQCIEYAARAYSIWEKTPKGGQVQMRKHTALCMRFGTLAYFSQNNHTKGLEFYEMALRVKSPFWMLGLLVSDHLFRLKQSSALDRTIKQLETWSAGNAGLRRQLQNFRQRHGLS